MSYTDQYEFKRSSEKQSIYDNHVVYTRKDYNYVNDITTIYTNNSMSLVTFDLSSIFNSSRWIDTNDLVLVLPIVMVAAYGDATGVVQAPTPANASQVSLMTMKNCHLNLIHQIDLQVNGKTINQLQPFTHTLKNFELLSTMTPGDLKVFGATYGMADVLDNPNSIRYRASRPDNTNTTATSIGNGSGYTNNTPYGRGGGSGFSASETQSSSGGPLNFTTGNTALAQRIARYADVSVQGVGAQNVFGSAALMSAEQLREEFKPYHEVVGGFMRWYDYAYIRIGHLCDSIRNIGLVKKFDCVMRVYVNTGSLAVPYSGQADATALFGDLVASSSTFSNACPFTLNFGCAAGAPVCTQIAAGLFLQKAPNTTVSPSNGNTAINLGASNAQNPMNTCRMIYSSIEIDKKREIEYAESNRSKMVIHRNFISNQINNVGSGNSYSALIQSGVSNVVAVVIFPFLSNANTNAFLPVGSPPQWGAVYDAGTGFSGSITNLQVSVGGRNMLDSSLTYTWESFMNNVSMYEQLTGHDLGWSNGLFSAKWWEMNRCYVVLTRGSDAEMNTPRNVNISFKNNTRCALDFLVYTVYLDHFVIDVLNGRVSQAVLSPE